MYLIAQVHINEELLYFKLLENMGSISQSSGKRFNGGTVPRFEITTGGTVPPLKRQAGGTLLPSKMHPSFCGILDGGGIDIYF